MVASSIHSDSLARCRQVLSQYFLNDPSATIVPIMGNEGFSGAEVYRIELHMLRYSLRRWPQPAPEIERLTGLHRLLEHTWKSGVTQIAVPLKSRSGSSLVDVDGSLWQLEPWMPGVADFHRSPSRPRLREAVSTLARWHAAAQTYVPRRDDRAWFATTAAAPSPGLQERWQAMRNYHHGGVQQFSPLLERYPDADLKAELNAIWKHFVRLFPTVVQGLATARLVSVPLQPCLRDVWHDHLLFTDEALTGLIDPNACRVENVTTDLARMLNSLVQGNRVEWDFALACYEEQRPLSLTENRLLRVFDTSGVLLSGMTWLDWLLVERRQFSNRDRILNRVQAIVRRLESLTPENW